MERLNDYVTYQMALDMLDAPRNQRMLVYRIIKEHDVEVVTKGRTKLINRSQFTEAAASSVKRRVNWPAHLAIIELGEMMTAQEVADELGITRRQVYNLLKENMLYTWDLSFWGGDKIIQRFSVEMELNRRQKRELALKRKRTPRWKHADANL